MRAWSCSAALLAFFVPTAAFAYGEPRAPEDPNPEERLLHVLTNQVRAEPHAWPGWDTSLATGDARQPLRLDDGLLEAARFHGDDMATNDFFEHESSDGTSFGDRVSRYFHGAGAGENIYMAYQGGARDGVTAWMNSAGHRTNILDGRWDALGTGFSRAGQKLYYVQDFGLSGAALPPIVGGAWEHTGPGKLLLVASWYDRGGRAPATFEASLGGTAIPLAHTVGGDGNAVWTAAADLPAACGALWFTAVDASGTKTVFPTTGALQVGATCAASYTATRPGETGGDGRPVIDADESGCTSTRAAPGAPGLAVALFALVLLGRKRR